MKTKVFLPICLFILTSGLPALAQEHDTTIVLKLDDQERLAILNRDTISLSTLMSSDIIVHNPENSIVGYRQIIERIRQGKINYARFERVIEKISKVNGLVTVMGLETIVSGRHTKNEGNIITRRFTNIWTKENGVWKLTVRQATIIKVVQHSPGNPG